MKKAIKIDAINKKIYEVEIHNELDDIYNHLDCDLFTCPVSLDNQDTLYVDDEGLLINLYDYKGSFYFKDFQQPLFGHGLIIGTNNEGDSVDVKSTVEEIEKLVSFIPDETGKHILNRIQGIDPEIIIY